MLDEPVSKHTAVYFLLIQYSYFVKFAIRQTMLYSNVSTSGTKITEVNSSAFVNRLFHEDFSPILRTNVDA